MAMLLESAPQSEAQSQAQSDMASVVKQLTHPMGLVGVRTTREHLTALLPIVNRQEFTGEDLDAELRRVGVRGCVSFRVVEKFKCRLRDLKVARALPERRGTWQNVMRLTW